MDEELLRAWGGFADAVAAMPGVLDHAPDAVAEADGYRYLLRFLAAGIAVCAAHDDTSTPDLGRSIDHRMSWGLDNPDCIYGYTRLDPGGTYRITGTRGSARHIEFQVNTGHQGDGDFLGWRAVGSLTGTDLGDTDAPDSPVEIVAAPPTVDVETLAAAYGAPPGTWTPRRLDLDEEASFLLVRQYFSDWDREVPAELVIERLDRPLPQPPPDPADVTGRIGLLETWLRLGLACWDELSRALMASPADTIQPFVPVAESSGLKGQAYGFGGFACAPDEALIVEFTPPAATMWGISLCDRWWQSIDFGHRQSSLNDHQSRCDPDGRFVGVISHDDPGVANWLDPGGHTAGTVAVRYLFADRLPPVHIRSVPRARLHEVLPAGTPRVTPAERRSTLARRHRAIARRHRTP